MVTISGSANFASYGFVPGLIVPAWSPLEASVYNDHFEALPLQSSTAVSMTIAGVKTIAESSTKNLNHPFLSALPPEQIARIPAKNTGADPQMPEATQMGQ